ncbi:N-acetylmuramoyl-L-alanine amidase [Bacillus badius]|uniref:N-acetylmuramoyl-L-alanine amidase n=1 Tax=Bacillus badius TaxID=1455 RepID=UPI002E1B88BE|nr:N-acetylmuramoyl-L-alanine amidase [Bacillus badius]
MIKILVLDFGHGLPDPGAVKYVKEYEWAMKIGKEVARRLPAGIKVVYTRTTDKALNSNKNTDLNKRCFVANQANADLFVSFHLNAGGGTGYETLVHSPSSAGNIVHGEIAKVIAKYGVKDRGIKVRPDVRVLNGTKSAALLLECLFVDSAADVAKLKDANFFGDFCQAIANGIAKYLGVSMIKPTQPATKPKEELKVEQYKKDAAVSPRFQEAQKWVKENGISDGTYPQRPVTREEVWSMLYRANKVNK